MSVNVKVVAVVFESAINTNQPSTLNCHANLMLHFSFCILIRQNMFITADAEKDKYNAGDVILIMQDATYCVLLQSTAVRYHVNAVVS